MTFGEAGKEGESAEPRLMTHYNRTSSSDAQCPICTGTRVQSVEGVKAILDIFQKHGHYEVRAPE